jgi:uncharacterized protein (TIGR02001 family)
MYMKMKTLSVLVVAALGAPLAAQAEDSGFSASGNVSLTSNYVSRGISQTQGKPAIQGGFDLAHSSGFYVGTWGSNVGWLTDFQGYTRGSMELDVYGGYSNSIGDISYDIGAIRYMYPGSTNEGCCAGAFTSEVYGSLGWKWFTAKLSYYVSANVFGVSTPDNGSYYADLSASYPVADTGLTLGAHWGTFKFKGNTDDADYDDWKVSADYDLGKLGKLGDGMTLGVAYTDTNASDFWISAGKDLGKATTTVYISKSL